VKVGRTTNDRNESQRLALSLADFGFTCFSVPMKQLKPNPVRVIWAGSRVAGRKMKIDDEDPDNLDFSLVALLPGYEPKDEK